MNEYVPASIEILYSIFINQCILNDSFYYGGSGTYADEQIIDNGTY